MLCSLSNQPCKEPEMRKSLLSTLVPALAIGVSYMSDPADGAAAAPAEPVEPTKESLIARVESLIEAGYADVKNWLSSAITHVEEAFEHTPGESNAAATDAAILDAESATTGSEAGNVTGGTTPAA